jgi:putative oxidoreductase
MNNNSTSPSWGLTILRVAVGIVFLMHGKQKLFGFGFHGVAGFLGSVGIPLPSVLAVVLTLVELLGGAALLLGVATRLTAVLLAIDMSVALLAVHLKGGFFAPAGIEFAMTLLAANICLALTGAGALSVDGMIANRE